MDFASAVSRDHYPTRCRILPTAVAYCVKLSSASIVVDIIALLSRYIYTGVL